jgi:hypothetical protein
VLRPTSGSRRAATLSTAASVDEWALEAIDRVNETDFAFRSAPAGDEGRRSNVSAGWDRQVECKSRLVRGRRLRDASQRRVVTEVSDARVQEGARLEHEADAHAATRDDRKRLGVGRTAERVVVRADLGCE